MTWHKLSLSMICGKLLSLLVFFFFRAKMNHMLAYKYFVLIRRTSIFICVLNILSSYSWLIIFVFRCFCKQMCWGTLMSMLLVDPFSCLFSRNYSGMLQHTIAFASSYIFPLYYIVSRSYLVTIQCTMYMH